MLFLTYVRFFQLETQALEDWRLKQVVNNCTDSAIEELLEASDLGMDYADWGRFNADPDLALDDYLTTFLLNYNMPITESNKEIIKTNFIKAFCVAGYDGYYIYDHRRVPDEKGMKIGGKYGSTYALVGSPKLPYLYRDYTKGDRYVTYALNMGYQRCYKLTDATITMATNPLGKAETMRLINNRISDDLMERVDRAYENGWLESVYIPSSLANISSTQPIESPTVLCFMDDVDLTSVLPVNAFGIGGSRARVARPVSGYKRMYQGRMTKFYSYHDLLPSTFADGSSIEAAIEQVFMSPEEAAEAGYQHDPLYMNK
ncbi:MAG: hypothetical protein NC131_21185 [Roseburia sp.]|nr:hypothetical protein [Roseburia sp.]